MEDPGDDRLSR